ncbi:hypothetical protein GF415_05155 [Candidatus Micrarchaeota archaeon]|nr:hypothetical protein [Candidatus Micrarchaeota archaeon]
MPGKRRRPDTFHFMVAKNFPKHKSFEVLKQPDSDFFSAFVKTLSQLFKGE